MAISTENIKQAFDKFEEEDFVTAKDILQKEIKAAKAEYLEKALHLETPLNVVPSTNAQNASNTED